MFRRRERVGFLRPSGDLNAIYGSATQRAGPYGTDSLDLLAAAAGAGSVGKVVRRLGLDPAQLAEAANEARASRQAGPGLTDDAKRVVEAVAHRSLARGRDASGPDLLLALATVDTAARTVLRRLKIDEISLRG
jgi:hypothetical protein